MKIKILGVIFLCFILQSLVYAEDTTAKGKAIKVAFGMTLPPYVFENSTGIEYDIIKRSLEIKGYSIKPYYVPFARVIKSIKDKDVEAAATVNEDAGLTDVHFSDSHITYQNVVVALASKKYKIEKIADLADKRIVAFQKATDYLGAEFAAMAKKNKDYTELANQELQIAMLHKDRVDVVVSDINIFKYYKMTSTKVDKTLNQEEAIYPVFAPVNYKVAFSDKKVRDDFNEGLKELKKSGEYNKIIANYIK